MAEEKIVRVPDPILAEPNRKKMPFKKKAVIFFIVGFVGGWVAMTWSTILSHQVGSSGLSFWRLILPF